MCMCTCVYVSRGGCSYIEASPERTGVPEGTGVFTLLQRWSGLLCVLPQPASRWKEPALLGRGSNGSLRTKRSPQTLSTFQKTEKRTDVLKIQ